MPALAGQSFANVHEIEQATHVATAQLKYQAKPWAVVGASSQDTMVPALSLFLITFQGA